MVYLKTESSKFLHKYSQKKIKTIFIATNDIDIIGYFKKIIYKKETEREIYTYIKTRNSICLRKRDF